MGQYIDKEGYTQTTLDLGINNGLDNRNLKQEEAEAKAKKKAEIEEKKNKEKNPTRVNAGVQAYKTRRKKCRK